MTLVNYNGKKSELNAKTSNFELTISTAFIRDIPNILTTNRILHRFHIAQFGAYPVSSSVYWTYIDLQQELNKSSW